MSSFLIKEALIYALLPLSLLKVTLSSCAHYPALSQWLTISSQHTFVSGIIKVRSHPVAKISLHFEQRWQFRSQNKLILRKRNARESCSQNKPFLVQDVSNMNPVQGFVGVTTARYVWGNSMTFPSDIWCSERTCCKICPFYSIGKAC